MKNSIQIGDYLIQQIYAHGVRHVFGIPGDYVLGFYERLSRSKLRLINTCAEKYTDSFSILDVRLDPHNLSPALQRLAKRLGKKVKEAE